MPSSTSTGRIGRVVGRVARPAFFGLLIVIGVVELLIVTAIIAGAFGRGADKPATLLWKYELSIVAAALSPDGKTFISGGGKVPGECIFWDFPGGQRRLTLTDTGMITHLAASPDGKLLATMGFRVEFDGNRPPHTWPRFGIWDPATGKELMPLRDPPGVDMARGRIAAMAFSPDSKLLAIAVGKVVEIHDLVTGKKQAGLEGHGSRVWSLAFSADGKLLATGGEDATVKIWDLAGMQVKTTLTGRKLPVSALAFSPDGKLLAAGESTGEYGRTGDVALWDLTTEKVREEWKTGQGRVTGVTFSPDGALLAFGACLDDKVQVRDIAGGKERFSLPAPLNLSALFFARDGKYLVAAGGTGDYLISVGAVKFWDAATGKEVYATAK
jgi:WD40 repeat protein